MEKPAARHASEFEPVLAARDRIRGEFVLLIEAPKSSRNSDAAGLVNQETREGTAPAKESISARISRLQSEAGIDEKEALKRLAREAGVSKSELYRELQRERARRK